MPLQGALLIDIIPRALPWARSFCPFRACCCGLLDIQGVLLWAAWPSGRAAYMGFWTISGRAAVGFWTFRAMLLWASWPFRACCLYGLLDLLGVLLWAFGAFRVCCYGLLDLQGVAAYMGFCPLPLLYPSASDFQFRYAPVTVVSGRDALTSPKLFRPV